MDRGPRFLRTVFARVSTPYIHQRRAVVGFDDRTVGRLSLCSVFRYIPGIERRIHVARLAQQKLDASIRSQSIARDIIRLESRDGIVLYGKTGWRFSSSPNLGWWTGWVERNGEIAAFSLNIDMPAASDAPKRVAVGKAMLAKLDVL